MRIKEENSPVIVLIDDNEDFCSSFYDFFRSMGYPLKSFLNQDAAIEYIMNTNDQIFLYIRDGSSGWHESNYISKWRKQFQYKTPLANTRDLNGSFSVYVVDAFTPEASQIFLSGGSLRKDKSYFSLLEKWAKVDPKVGIYFKPTDLFKIEKVVSEQLKCVGQNDTQKPISKENKLLHLVSREMAFLCNKNSRFLDRMTPRKFEELIADIFKNHGFFVELTSQTRDGGFDVVAAHNSKLDSELILIEVKHFAAHRPVDVGVIRALYGVKSLNKASKAVLVTSSYVSKYAKKEFERVIPWELELVERERVLGWCRDYAKNVKLIDFD